MLELKEECGSCTCEAGQKTGFKRVKRKQNWRKVDWKEQVWIRPVEVEDENERRMRLRFQVADVKKPLVAVRRFCEKENMVSFGPKEEDNFIQNKISGDKMMLRPNGRGSYLMDVCFVGGAKTTITVDSGAEESVCPYEWGKQFGMTDADKWMSFKNAGGGMMEHYGQRDVLLTSTF